ncbi:MAG: squalene/phytoene synthase family protein [Gemmatimonadaceae bacterium]
MLGFLDPGVGMRRSMSLEFQAGSDARRKLDDLLAKTSRTFAITIPLLPEPTQLEVTIAYLLFRVADTLEDATLWPQSRKLEELDAFARFLGRPTDSVAVQLSNRWTIEPPVEHAGYLQLMSELPFVMQAATHLSRPSWSIIARHSARTTRGMASFVSREADGRLGLRDIADLKAYCYAVAGIVGEMLTELFLLGRQQLASVANELRADASAFGEGLQLVNILKDSDADVLEGRRYLPVGTDPARVFELAFSGLDAASRYCVRLEAAGAERGLLASTALPIVLARATLERLQQMGPGAKLGHAQVAVLVRRLQVAVAGGRIGELVTKQT